MQVGEKKKCSCFLLWLPWFKIAGGLWRLVVTCKNNNQKKTPHPTKFYLITGASFVLISFILIVILIPYCLLVFYFLFVAIVFSSVGFSIGGSALSLVSVTSGWPAHEYQKRNNQRWIQRFWRNPLAPQLGLHSRAPKECPPPPPKKPCCWAGGGGNEEKKEQGVFRAVSRVPKVPLNSSVFRLPLGLNVPIFGTM